MSILTVVAEQGVLAALKLVPWYYTVGVIIVILAGILVWGKMYFDRKVHDAAEKVIAAYVSKDEKDAQELTEVTASNNTKIELRYLDRVKVITKVVHDNANTIKENVPGPNWNPLLTKGWVSTYDAVVHGSLISPSMAADKTLSQYTVTDALLVDNVNYGICLQYKEKLDGWQEWYKIQVEAIKNQNKKDQK